MGIGVEGKAFLPQCVLFSTSSDKRALMNLTELNAGRQKHLHLGPCARLEMWGELLSPQSVRRER